LPNTLIEAPRNEPFSRESDRKPLAVGTLAYSCTIFSGAFLLFEIQPAIARVVVPWFGGTAAVWTTCMLFFQTALLAGYLYAYFSVSYLRPRTQVALHIALLALSVLMLPIAPHASWKPTGAEDPSLRILGLLALTIGLPYFLLSTTSPLLQAWYTRSEARLHPGSQTSSRPAASPYRLFALSNAASVLALLAYPSVVEPFLTTHRQMQWWSAGYLGFALLCGGTALLAWRRGLRSAENQNAESDEPERPEWSTQLLWVALAGGASALMLSVTNHLSKNVAPIPFLWVLPLGLYLLSFILCFEGRGWYKRGWWLRSLPLAFTGTAYGLSIHGETLSVRIVIPIFSVSLLIFCMVCHGELAHLKPHPRYLTSFYLMCSLGGVLGGVFVGLVAPYLFKGPYELPLSIVFCTYLPAVVLYGHPTVDQLSTAKWQGRAALAGLALLLMFYISTHLRGQAAGTRLMTRNFYGVLKVMDNGQDGSLYSSRSLVHGIVDHGLQYRHPTRRRNPTAYYGRNSGVGLALSYGARQPRQRVGIIGLGAGVLAAYGRAGDYYRFYEINPLVIQISQSQFSFLKDSPAKVDTVLGDARLALERETRAPFDTLIVDAFSGDAVPVHLLTREAFDLYFEYLKPGGVLAMHLSSQYLDLVPGVALAAEALRKEARLITNERDDSQGIYPSIWVLITGGREFFEDAEIRERAKRIEPSRNLRLWTDDYSNLLAVVR